MISRLEGWILIGVLLVVSPVAARSQQDTLRFNSQRQFTVQQLQQDFRVLRAALEEGHAGLYRYSPKSEMDLRFDEVAVSINEPMTEFAFVQTVAPLIASIHDGHTRLDGSLGLAAYFEQRPIRLPFKLRFLNGKAYMHRNYMDDPAFAMGSEVLSINDMAMSEIVDRLFRLTRADGNGEGPKYRAFEGTSNFGTLFSLAFGETTEFDIRYRSRDGGVHTMSVGGLTNAEVAERFQARYPDAGFGGTPIALTYRDDVAVLTITTFGASAYRRAGINYSVLLRDIFDELNEKNVEHLVLDLRGNGGGSDEFGKILFAHLTSQDFEYYRSLELNKNQFDFLRFTDASNNSIPQDRLHLNDHGTFDMMDHVNLGVHSPMDPVFNGPVYVIIDAGTFSAASEFTSVLHHTKRATFIGEEGGGGYYGNTSGFVATLTLPHTRVRVNIPMVKYTMAVEGYEPMDRGLIPDHVVTPTMDDVLVDRDAQLDYIFELISNRN